MQKLPGGISHTTSHVGRLIPVIKKQQLSGRPIDLGVRRQASVAASFELEVALGFQSLRIQAVGMTGVVPQGHQATCVVKQVRIGGVFDAKG